MQCIVVWAGSRPAEPIVQNNKSGVLRGSFKLEYGAAGDVADQARYGRMEQALNALVDSISAYNPSLTAADKLVEADDEVNEALEQLALHQANYARILSLRQTAEALDGNIKSTLKMLAETRKELLAIPAKQDATPSREVPVDELLSYAKFISKTTVPPTFRGHIPKDILSKDQPAEQATTQITNGMATPAGTGPDGDPTQQQVEGIGISTLNQDVKDSLDPLSKLPFVPWPSQDIIRMGALADIQGMLEDGRDPSTVLSREEQQAEEKRKLEEAEKSRLEEEERERRWKESYAMRAARPQEAEAVFDPDEL